MAWVAAERQVRSAVGRSKERLAGLLEDRNAISVILLARTELDLIVDLKMV